MNGILTGGGALLRRVTDWCTQDTTLIAAGRIIGTSCACLFGGSLLLASPSLWWPTAAGWLIACWYHRPTEQATTDDIDPDKFLVDLHLMIGDRKGMHVATIAEQYLNDRAATKQIRALCNATGVKVSAGIRVDGAVSTGIKRADLPPLPQPLLAAAAAAVSAGQDSNNNSNNTPTGQPREGYLIKDRPGSPGSGDIIWKDQP